VIVERQPWMLIGPAVLAALSRMSQASLQKQQTKKVRAVLESFWSVDGRRPKNSWKAYQVLI
jgi:hypothetical protein